MPMKCDTLMKDIIASIDASLAIPKNRSGLAFAAWGLIQIIGVVRSFPSRKIPEQFMKTANEYSDHVKQTKGKLKEQTEEIDSLNL